MANIGEVTAVLNADTSGFTGGIAQAVDTLGELGGALGTTRGGIVALGAAAGTAAAAGLAAATAQAAQFERTIAGAAARAGATQQAFDAFGSAAKQASLDSAFGANEAGGALRFLAKSGFEVEQATSALPGILRGATAAGMGAAEMGEIASNALRQFGRSANETGEVMDVLVKASTSANTSVQELGKGLSIVGGLANEANMSVAETSALFAKLQDAGIGASRAATAMRMGISKLLSPSKDGQAALDRLGVSAKNAQDEFRGLIPIIADLEKQGASASDMLAIFGREAGPTLQTALSQGGGALKSFRNELQDAEGTTEEIAGFIRDTLTEQLSVLWGSIKTLGANIGSFALPALKAMTVAAQGLVEALNFTVNAIKGVLVPLGEWTTVLPKTKKGTDELAGSTQKAADKLKGISKNADAAASSTREQASAQRELNKEVKKFQDMDLAGKREAFGGLVDEATSLRNQIDQTENRIAQMQATFESRTGVSAERADPRAFQGTEMGRLLGEIDSAQNKLAGLRKEQTQVEEKITESATASNTLTEEEKAQLKQVRLGNKALRASSKLEEARLEKKQEIARIEADESLPSELKAAEVEKARIKYNQRIADLKQKQSEGDHDQFMGAFSDQPINRGQDLRAAKRRGESMGAFTPSRPSMARPERPGMVTERRGRQTEIMGAGTVEKTEQAEESVDQMNKQMQKNVQAGGQFAVEMGRAASSIARASGASRDTTKMLDAAVSGVQGMIGPMAAVAAQGWSFASAMSVATAGISLVAGLVAAGASQAGRDSGGATTSSASETQSQRKFADLLATRIADEQERRGLQPVELRIAGRSGGRTRQSEMEAAREVQSQLDEADALQGVGFG